MSLNSMAAVHELDPPSALRIESRPVPKKLCRVVTRFSVKKAERNERREVREHPGSSISVDHESIEVTLICSRDTIDLIAGRIERAYRRRNPNWQCIGRTSGIWESAASRLLEVSVESPRIPIDPELFVAVLARGGISPDPWAELTQKGSQARYIKVLRTIIVQLRRELKQEIRRAERQLQAGLSLEEILERGGDRFSPMTCYILALRERRFDLTDKYRELAENQHRSCPLYRQATLPILPAHAYPCTETKSDLFHVSPLATQFSWN